MEKYHDQKIISHTWKSPKVTQNNDKKENNVKLNKYKWNHHRILYLYSILNFYRIDIDLELEIKQSTKSRATKLKSHTRAINHFFFIFILYRQCNRMLHIFACAFLWLDLMRLRYEWKECREFNFIGLKNKNSKKQKLRKTEMNDDVHFLRFTSLCHDMWLRVCFGATTRISQVSFCIHNWISNTSWNVRGARKWDKIVSLSLSLEMLLISYEISCVYRIV